MEDAVRVGHLRDSITIETPSGSVSSYGEPVDTWTTFATVFGELRSVSGREYMQSERIQGDVSHMITIRHLTGLLPKMRAKIGTRIFEIIAVLPDRTNAKFQQVIAREKAS
jgi:SPP1 family predicted phage head-tail adaptor